MTEAIDNDFTALVSFMRDELNVDSSDLGPDTSLVGADAIVDSLGLVQISLFLEERATDEGWDFDWTSEKAMSVRTSMYRTIESILHEFDSQRQGAG